MARMTPKRKKAKPRQRTRDEQVMYISTVRHHVGAYRKTQDDEERDQAVCQVTQRILARLYELGRTVVPAPTWPPYRTHREKLASFAGTLLSQQAQGEITGPPVQELDQLLLDLEGACDEAPLEELATRARSGEHTSGYIRCKIEQWCQLHPDHFAIKAFALAPVQESRTGQTLRKLERDATSTERLTADFEANATPCDALAARLDHACRILAFLADETETWPPPDEATPIDILSRAIARHEQDHRAFDEDRAGVLMLARAACEGCAQLRRGASWQIPAALMCAVDTHLVGFQEWPWFRDLGIDRHPRTTGAWRPHDDYGPNSAYWEQAHMWWHVLVKRLDPHGERPPRAAKDGDLDESAVQLSSSSVRTDEECDVAKRGDPQIDTLTTPTRAAAHYAEGVSAEIDPETSDKERTAADRTSGTQDFARAIRYALNEAEGENKISFRKLLAAIQQNAGDNPSSERFVRDALRSAGVEGTRRGRELLYPVDQAIRAYVDHVRRGRGPSNDR